MYFTSGMKDLATGLPDVFVHLPGFIRSSKSCLSRSKVDQQMPNLGCKIRQFRLMLNTGSAHRRQAMSPQKSFGMFSTPPSSPISMLLSKTPSVYKQHVDGWSSLDGGQQWWERAFIWTGMSGLMWSSIEIRPSFQQSQNMKLWWPNMNEGLMMTQNWSRSCPTWHRVRGELSFSIMTNVVFMQTMRQEIFGEFIQNIWILVFLQLAVDHGSMWHRLKLPNDSDVERNREASHFQWRIV